MGTIDRKSTKARPDKKGDVRAKTQVDIRIVLRLEFVLAATVVATLVILIGQIV